MTMPPTWFFRSEFWQEVRAEARAEVRAEDIVELLELREIAVPDEVRARIATCTDLHQLAIWFYRAVKAEIIDDLFVQGASPTCMAAAGRIPPTVI